MLFTIPSTVQGVGTAVMAPKPFSFLRKKSATGGGGARRALAVLGSNNAQFNMKQAKSHLAISQEVFMNRWNFNPAKEVPVAPGRYQWAPLSGAGYKDITSTPSGVVEKDITLSKDITKLSLISSRPFASKVTDMLISSQDALNRKCMVPISTNNQENSENEVNSECTSKQPVVSPSCEAQVDSKKNVSPGSQMCVTDFFRPQKRKSCNQYEEFKPNTPPKKKLRVIH